MARLSAGAEQILEHLRRRGGKTFTEGYDLEGLFHQWDNYVDRVSFFNRYPDMTDHGRAHANNVVTLVAQLALNGDEDDPGGRLNASEIFCLTGAAWLHDIGMYTTGETGSDDVYDAMTIRKKHSGLSRDKMREERHIIFPGVPERDVRIISAIAAYHQSRTVLDERHGAALLEKGTRAGKAPDLVQGMPTIEEEVRNQGWSDGTAALECWTGKKPPERIRVKLLAAFLRVLDQCDIQMNRAGNLDFLVRRVDRSHQQRRMFEALLEAIPVDGPDAAKRLRDRISQEVKFFRETNDYYLRDFHVEKTFILGRRIYVKLNDESQFKAQLALVPPSLQAAREKVENDRTDLSSYFAHAHAYILKELEMMRPYLEEAGFELEVCAYPASTAERRKARSEIRRRAFFRDATPSVPRDYEEPPSARPLVRELKAGPRAVVLFAPPGRGKKQYALRIAKELLQAQGEGDLAGLWWHELVRGSQVRDAVSGAAAYLASLGEYTLGNVFNGEPLVSDRHVDFCLDALASSELPRIIVLQDLNLIEKHSRRFFASFFQRLRGKTVIATTTKWPGEDAAKTYFEGVDAAFVEVPRLPRTSAGSLFGMIGTGSEQEWGGWWDGWGRESALLGNVSANAWLKSSGKVLRALADAFAMSHFVGIWERLGSKAVAQSLVALARGEANGPHATSVAIQELVDRGLARWESAPGIDPWSGEDVGMIRTERAKPSGSAWVHPGFRTLFQE